jgi:hypothetical protein
MKTRDYDDDDGRVVADMSGIDDRSLVGRWLGLPEGKISRSRREMPDSPQQMQAKRADPYGAGEMDTEERRVFIFGAMKASLMLGMVYLVIFAIVIGILVFIW